MYLPALLAIGSGKLTVTCRDNMFEGHLFWRNHITVSRVPNQLFFMYKQIILYLKNTKQKEQCVSQVLHTENPENRSVNKQAQCFHHSVSQTGLLHKSTTEVTASKCSLPQVFRFVVNQGYRDRATLHKKTEGQLQLFECKLARHLFELNTLNDLF